MSPHSSTRSTMVWLSLLSKEIHTYCLSLHLFWVDLLWSCFETREGPLLEPFGAFTWLQKSKLQPVATCWPKYLWWLPPLMGTLYLINKFRFWFKFSQWFRLARRDLCQQYLISPDKGTINIATNCRQQCHLTLESCEEIFPGKGMNGFRLLFWLPFWH